MFSKKLYETNNKAIFINDNILEEVIKLKNKPGKDIWLYGGASLITTFINLGLVDRSGASDLRENAGKVALQRGPVVYCLEEEDNGPNLQDIVLPSEAEFDVHFEEGLFGGVSVLTGSGLRSEVQAGDENKLYTTQAFNKVAAPLKAIPYFAWSNRTPGEMMVWIRNYN